MQLFSSVAVYRLAIGSYRSNPVCGSAHPNNHGHPEERFSATNDRNRHSLGWHPIGNAPQVP
jgi:hypothetical protein